jgi:hypothetical protein
MFAGQDHYILRPSINLLTESWSEVKVSATTECVVLD